MWLTLHPTPDALAWFLAGLVAWWLCHRAAVAVLAAGAAVARWWRWWFRPPRPVLLDWEQPATRRWMLRKGP